MKLYVCGDSYASLVVDQPKGLHWSELVAEKLNRQLVNLARPAAANSLISIQLDWVIDRIGPDDTVVVFLTDHFRLLETVSSLRPNISLLEQTALHRLQRPNIDYQYAAIESGTIMNPTSEAMKSSFTAFDPLLHYYIDSQIMLGTLSRLRAKTDRFLVVAGGWGRSLPISRSADRDLTLAADNYLDCDVAYLNGLNSEPTRYINHLTDLAHAKLAVRMYHKIKIFSS